jgi:hypothetical protein
MARARNIKPGFFKNEELAECSVWARLCFAGLWTLADREGRLEDRAKRIKGELFAFDSVEVDPLLDELAVHGFIVRYQVDELRAIQIMKFHEHQTPHYSEKPSVIKPPRFRESDPDDDRRTPETSGINHSSRGGHNLLNPSSLNPSSLNPSPPRAGARGAGGSSQGSGPGSEPAWRTAERKRIAAVAPAAVSGDMGVFDPIDETHEHEG